MLLYDTKSDDDDLDSIDVNQNSVSLKRDLDQMNGKLECMQREMAAIHAALASNGDDNDLLAQVFFDRL